MKKNNKVLFVVLDYDTGGITSSLRAYINLLNKDCDISILNLNGDPIPDSLNSEINQIFLNKKAQIWNLKTKDLKKKPWLIFLGIIKKILNRIGVWNKHCFKKMVVGSFDCVIGFRQSPIILDFIKYSMPSCQNKICFWHGDPDYMTGINKWIKKLEAVNRIICVSKYVAQRMKDLYPFISDKVITIYNPINYQEITNLAEQNCESGNKQTKNDVLKLITVSRVSFQDKGVDLIPSIAHILKDNGIHFVWTIIGDGPDFSELEYLVNKSCVSEYVHLLGRVDNPYKCIAESDVFVLTSKTESFGIVLLESMYLHIPCISTNFPAAHEIIKNNIDGLICENGAKDIANKIIEFYYNKELKKTIISNLNNKTYNNLETKKKILELIENGKEQN